jgi:hypothetical protein
MYTFTWSMFCFFGLHRWCDAQWDVMGGRATCNCDKDNTKHRWNHTGTFEPTFRINRKPTTEQQGELNE